MGIEGYHATLPCKIQGTWNLHNVALEKNLQLDFFTMLSSITSVLGSKGQGNYAAGNSFLDAFSSYRRGLGLAANTINLGVIEDVGYIARNDDLLSRLPPEVTPYINEALLSRILQYSLLQQTSEPLNAASQAQTITGLAMPQPTDSFLRNDARLLHLFSTDKTSNAGDDTASGAASDKKSIRQELRELNLLLKSTGTSPRVVLDAMIGVISSFLARMLRLNEVLEPERPLSAYGIDSLAAVEFRNWTRKELGAVLTVMDVSMAPSLISLCEKIIAKSVLT